MDTGTNLPYKMEDPVDRFAGVLPESLLRRYDNLSPAARCYLDDIGLSLIEICRDRGGLPAKVEQVLYTMEFIDLVQGGGIEDALESAYKAIELAMGEYNSEEPNLGRYDFISPEFVEALEPMPYNLKRRMEKLAKLLDSVRDDDGHIMYGLDKSFGKIVESMLLLAPKERVEYSGFICSAIYRGTTIFEGKISIGGKGLGLGEALNSIAGIIRGLTEIHVQTLDNALGIFDLNESADDLMQLTQTVHNNVQQTGSSMSDAVHASERARFETKKERVATRKALSDLATRLAEAESKLLKKIGTEIHPEMDPRMKQRLIDNIRSEATGPRENGKGNVLKFPKKPDS